MSYTNETIQKMERKATSLAPENKAFLERLLKTKPKNLDKIVHGFHTEEFDKINCLECARCCKGLGPMLFESDIERMASSLKMKTSAFKNQYITMDEDGDNIFKEKPCPFLSHDNLCVLYTSRPKACREYPHTNRKRFYQVSIKTYHNTFTCPAVFNIVNRLKDEFRK